MVNVLSTATKMKNSLPIFDTNIICFAIISLKPIASCAMPVMNGMRIKTNSENTKKARLGNDYKSFS